MRVEITIPTRLEIAPTVARQIQAYVTVCPTEISWLGEVEVRGSVATVVNTLLFEQECSYGHTDLDMTAVTGFFAKRWTERKDPKRVRFWGHSHGSMPVFFSETDKATCNRLARDFFKPLLIAGVFNKAGEARWRLQTSEGYAEVDGPRLEAKLSKEELRTASEVVQKYVKEKKTLWDYFFGDGTKWDYFSRRGEPCPPEQCRYRPQHTACDKLGHEPEFLPRWRPI